MATLHFKLFERYEKDSKTGKSTPVSSTSIVLHFRYGTGGKKRLRYSTGYKLENVKNWNTEKQRIKNVADEPNKLKINNKLDEIQSFIGKYYIDLKSDNLRPVTNNLLIN